MATHSSILAWRSPWTAESRGLQSMWSQRVDMTEATQHRCSHRNIGLPGSSCNAGDPALIPGLGRSLEKEMTTDFSILA